MPRWCSTGPTLLRALAALGLAWSVGFAPLPGRAQEPPPEPVPPASAPPEVGPIVLANPLVGTVGLPTGACPTGRNKSEPVGEGYIFKVTGRCAETDPIALFILRFTDIMFPDGEVRIEAKIVSGHERASFIVAFRNPEGAFGYEAAVVPALDLAVLFRGENQLVIRKDLAGLMARDDWNSVAVRARGPDIWLLVNDRLVAQASDPTFHVGRLAFILRRLGDPNDPDETAAVIRNLRVSRLAEGDPERAPTIGR